MDIEIAEPGRMTQAGSSLLKLIQNNNMPILDLLVRETIQNSLDAKDNTKKYVNVNFATGTFNKNKFNNELKGITDELNKKYINEEYDYIAINDTNTVGLTGKLHYDDVVDNDYGNLLKLIYEISKPQNVEGSGGSWGLGKTVYFRVGMGLVLYYSRIKTQNGKYESRMAACLVEDENSKHSLIPKYKGKSKRGIAWWGQRIGENKTQPITDEQYISFMLDIFNIKPYKDDETGTIIIIPYINSEQLLLNNQVTYMKSNGVNNKLFWNYSIEDYIRISIQRWYSPRLNNVHYKYGEFLRASVNSKGITQTSMEPVYKVIQSLYNRAITNGQVDFEDILSECDVKYANILLRNVLKFSNAGVICFVKLNKDTLGMCYPYNKPSPYEYFNCINDNTEVNKPIATFTRKPGMLVSYENIGAWVDGIQHSDKDNYIIGIFVLNSENELNIISEKYLLEEYIRKGEMADHTSWNDFSFGDNNPRIVEKIQKHVRRKIAKEFIDYNQLEIEKKNSGIGKKIGDLLLPPLNFGKKPSILLKNKNQSKNIQKQGDIISSIDKKNINYMNDGIEVTVSVKVKNKIHNMELIVGVDAEGGIINFDKWERKMKIKFPFSIQYIKIKLLQLDQTRNLDSKITLDKNKYFNEYGLNIEQLKNNNICYGFKISSEKAHKYIIECKLKLKMNREDFKPSFSIESDRGII